jgi:TPP-dependent indolepyruvate ferredoxin oxidoreductase alpha subunit
MPVIPVLSPRFSESEIQIFPNPAFDFVKIKSTQNELIRTIQLVNMAGQILFESTNLNALETEIPMANKQTGIYLVRVLTESSSITRKIQILQR